MDVGGEGVAQGVKGEDNNKTQRSGKADRRPRGQRPLMDRKRPS